MHHYRAVLVSAVHPRDALDELRAPRTDVVIERAAGGDHFVSARGPFKQYERRLEVGDDSVTETTQFRLSIPFWWFLFVGPYRAAFRRPVDRRAHRPWWAPPDPLDARAASVLGLLCLLSLVDGYVGTLLTQTVTYVAAEFGASRGDQGTVLAIVRAGALIALAAGVLADRHGRRWPMIACGAAACVFASLGALAPNLAVLTATQLAAIGAGSALGVLIAVVSAEEVPRGSRAYAFSLIVMSAALGAGMCVWVLPLADTGTRGWRWIYVIALLGLALVAIVGRHLPESRRFERLPATEPSPQTRTAGHQRRLWLLASAGFLVAVFAAPAFQFQNDFLREDRGFSAARITLFTLLTSTPAAIGIVAGGRLADVRGRRIVGAIGLAGGTIATVLMFAVAGWPMWAWSVIGGIVGGLTVPALGVYRPELFPTRLRGKAAGLLELIGVCGSAAGLIFVGHVADRWGSFAGPIAITGIAALAVAVLVLVAFPETAQRSLEELNPEDAVDGPDDGDGDDDSVSAASPASP
ncbi:MAG TPA: MFS transporter [Acidimicrobiales bacterium]|jgi:putative MFS transporter